MQRETLERASFLVLAVSVSLAFGWILSPFFGTIFWAIVLSILLTPVYQRMLAMLPRRGTLASLATVMMCVVVVIVPLGLLSATLIQEATQLYQRTVTEQLDLGAFLKTVESATPSWLRKLLGVVGLGGVAAFREALTTGARSEQVRCLSRSQYRPGHIRPPPQAGARAVPALLLPARRCSTGAAH